MQNNLVHTLAMSMVGEEEIGVPVCASVSSSLTSLVYPIHDLGTVLLNMLSSFPSFFLFVLAIFSLLFLFFCLAKPQTRSVSKMIRTSE